MPRILLIEDSPTQARAIGLVLEAAGFHVATAESAEEGLERLESEIFDVVLSDLMLPGASGIDVCRRIHGDARWRQIPVVLLTGVDDESVATRALCEGAQDYLVKGEVNDKWVVRAVRHAIERNIRKRRRRSGRQKRSKPATSGSCTWCGRAMWPWRGFWRGGWWAAPLRKKSLRSWFG